MERSKKLKKMVTISMMSAIGFILMAFLQIPVPGFPPFLQIDVSDTTALITMLLYGPLAGVSVSLLKNIVYFITTGGTAGVPVGELANFLASVTMLFPTYYIWKRHQTLKGLITGLLVSTVVMTVVLSVANYSLIYPLYEKLVGLSIPNLRSFIVTAIVPFNVLKGLFVTFIFGMVFVSLKSWFQVQGLNKQV